MVKHLVRPENVLATDRVVNTRLPVSETQSSEDRSAHREALLRAIEEALTKTRIDAEAVEQPVLVYFLDMAIAEVKSGISDHNGYQGVRQKIAANVIQFVSCATTDL